mmetsp:Transcript_18321/g.64886  ORF Transcript_18321/g.64886 Transcript_18321/m.64886 type:complete len:231 (-) Transcript_18321:1225-1917(-)
MSWSCARRRAISSCCRTSSRAQSFFMSSSSFVELAASASTVAASRVSAPRTCSASVKPTHRRQPRSSALRSRPRSHVDRHIAAPVRRLSDTERNEPSRSPCVAARRSSTSSSLPRNSAASLLTACSSLLDASSWPFSFSTLPRSRASSGSSCGSSSPSESAACSASAALPPPSPPPAAALAAAAARGPLCSKGPFGSAGSRKERSVMPDGKKRRSSSVTPGSCSSDTRCD